MSFRGVPTEAVIRKADLQPPDEKPPKSNMFAALKSPAYRYFFGGQFVSLTGTWMQTVAQQIVVYQMTKSELALGVVACAQGLPSLLLAPFSGVIVERYSRRRILVFAQIVMMILAFILVALYVSGHLAMWHMIALSIGLGTATALDAPARLSFLSEMVNHEDLPSAAVLNSLMFNSARVLGPAFGGQALLVLGPAWCFLLNGLSFFAVLVSLLRMKIRPTPAPPPKTAFWMSFFQGIRFARTHISIGPLLLLSALSSTFGITFTVLITPFASDVLGNPEVGTSAILTANGLGALFGTLLLLLLSNRGFRGWLVVFGALIAPISSLALSFSHTYPPILMTAGIAGGGYVVQFVTTNSLLQLNVPNKYRGRILSLYTITFFGLAPFGSLLIGIIGQQMGSVIALQIFSVLTFLGASLILWRVKAIRQLK
jgi:MFS family permease